MSDRTLGRARGLNSIADPSDFKGSRGRPSRPAEEPTPPPVRHDVQRDGQGDAQGDVQGHVQRDAQRDAQGDGPEQPPTTPHRAVVPGVRRKRRELSIPVPIAEAVEATGINPADVVMSAYRRHGDAIYAGAGGRMVARGRQRLRLSISDSEFDKLTRLGEARGWNRSETVAVLLAMELLTTATEGAPPPERS